MYFVHTKSYRILIEFSSDNVQGYMTVITGMINEFLRYVSGRTQRSPNIIYG